MLRVPAASYQCLLGSAVQYFMSAFLQFVLAIELGPLTASDYELATSTLSSFLVPASSRRPATDQKQPYFPQRQPCFLQR